MEELARPVNLKTASTETRSEASSFGDTFAASLSQSLVLEAGDLPNRAQLRVGYATK
jgi:hypothetical protein